MDADTIHRYNELGIVFHENYLPHSPTSGGTVTLPPLVGGAGEPPLVIPASNAFFLSILQVLRSVDEDLDNIPNMSVHEERVMDTAGNYGFRYILFIGESKSLESKVFLENEDAIKDLLKKILISGVTDLVANATGIKLSGL